MVHPARLGERERLSNEARKPLAQGVDPTLYVASLAFFLAGGLMLLWWDHFPVSLPQVAVAGRLLIALGNLLPQALTGRSAPIARHEGHHLASFSTQGQPHPHLIALAVNEGPYLVQFEHLVVIGCLEEGLLQLAQGRYLFLSQPMTVVGETPKVRLSPRRLERSW